jgi:hypothetical protein
VDELLLVAATCWTLIFGSSNKSPSTSWTKLQHVDGNMSPERATFNKLPATSRL